MLTRLGFKADTVTSGPDALKALNEQAYTIVLTDIRMPKMTGLQLLTQIQDEGHEVLTVVMTGFYMDFSWVDVVNCGATDFINKPFGIKELDAKMKRVISERNRKKSLRN